MSNRRDIGDNTVVAIAIVAFAAIFIALAICEAMSPSKPSRIGIEVKSTTSTESHP